MECGWIAHGINGFLLDVYGVLYDSGSSDIAIDGSAEAVKKLKSAGIPLRICSNTSSKTSQMVAAALTSLGFEISLDEVFTPIPAVKQYLRQNMLRPYVIVDPAVEAEFNEFDQSDPNCVVLGDATTAFTYTRLNSAFRLLMQQPGIPLITMGTGKYYKDVDGIMLDVGPFTKGLEYACGVEATVIGKPSKEFFMAALSSMNMDPQDAVMIGDDIVSDISGAQACGVRGIQVRTGKYRPEDEPHPSIKPDAYVDNLLHAVDDFLTYSAKQLT